MFSTRTHGSLAVIEETQDRRRIEAELQRLDPRLFLDSEIDLQGNFVWTVKEWQGSETEPRLLFEWRDLDAPGRPPIPLTFGILDRVKSLERRSEETAFQRADAANEALRAQREEDAIEAYEDINRDMLPRLNPVRSVLLPRGVYLRMSRDKRRARGEKC